MSAVMRYLLGALGRVQNSRGKRAVIVQVPEILLHAVLDIET